MNVQADNDGGQRIAGPHVACEPAHLQEPQHVYPLPAVAPSSASAIQRALRSRRSSSPRARVSSNATKYAVNPASISSNGNSIATGMVGRPNFMTLGA